MKKMIVQAVIVALVFGGILPVFGLSRAARTAPGITSRAGAETMSRVAFPRPSSYAAQRRFFATNNAGEKQKAAAFASVKSAGSVSMSGLEENQASPSLITRFTNLMRSWWWGSAQAENKLKNTLTEDQKLSAIKTILEDLDSKNQYAASPESIAENFDYVCELYSGLGLDSQRQLLGRIMRAGIKTDRWDSNEYIKSVFAKNYPDALRAALDLYTATEFMSFIKKLRQTLSRNQKRQFVGDVLICMAEKNQGAMLTTEFIKALYKLLPKAADLNVFSDNASQLTPLMAAIQMENVRLVNLLIKSGADVNLYNDQKQTPLDFTQKQIKDELYDNLKLIDQILVILKNAGAKGYQELNVLTDTSIE